jgi:signal transduction histidine kinase
MILADTIKVLLIEDNLAEARFLQELMNETKLLQLSLVHVKRLAEGLDRLQQEDFDAILLDLTLPDSEGLASLAPIVRLAPHLPIVVLTNTNDDRLAIEAVRQGAQDFLVKRHVNLDLLVRSLCYAIERKQATAQLQQVNQTLAMRVQERTAELVKAKELNQLQSEFVSMISHDFRNPMNIILLSAGLLQHSQDKLSKEQQFSYFQLIRSALKDMDRLLTEVLLLGRADSGKLQCQLAPLDLKQFCHQLSESIEVSTDRTHQIVFSTQGQIGEGLWDKNLLQHIFSNLLTNAIKYSPEETTVEFELIGGEEKVIFRIGDRGIGIPPEAKAQLFHPFYRAPNVDTIPGTGLGLAIASKCVEACQGQISVESQVGVGTTFTVTLPVISDQ